MENAGSGPKIGQSLEVLRVTTPSCDRFLGFDRFSIISMLGKQWAMQIAGGGGGPLSTLNWIKRKRLFVAYFTNTFP